MILLILFFELLIARGEQRNYFECFFKYASIQPYSPEILTCSMHVRKRQIIKAAHESDEEPLRNSFCTWSGPSTMRPLLVPLVWSEAIFPVFLLTRKINLAIGSQSQLMETVL